MTSFRSILAVIAAAACIALWCAPAWSQSPAPFQALPRGFDANAASAPLFAAALTRARSEIDPYLRSPPDVPTPRDRGGGYTHERHKDNYRIIRDAGMLYAATGERAYADLVRDILLRYAALYPRLGPHPNTQGSQPGRLFWQSLNDSVWLVESIQGYAQVRDALTPQERERIERDVFRRMATFLSRESPETFNRIHNHGTWAVAAVGMTGYVLNDRDMVRRALYGLDGSGAAGFYKQIDALFSPDGYYTEGPYYQRYAMAPFILFARTIESYEPQRRIFEHRGRVLVRAVYTLIQSSYAGRFFPINDAIREKGLDTTELLHGVAVAFALTRDPALLSIAELQGRVALTPDGVNLAAALRDRRSEPFPFRSLLLRDGADGNDGALAILRSGRGPRHLALVFEATAQGMGHGHFDRLSWIFYDAGREVVADYGAARFLNVEAKDGGRYLPENESWAKTSIAHNTLVADETSHFAADLRRAEAARTQFLHFDEKDGVQFAAARIADAYPDIVFSRAVALIDRPEIGHPIVLDLIRASGGRAHRYDLPVHYEGAPIGGNLAFSGGTDRLTPLGARSGYQHLWDRGRAPVRGGARLAWFNEDRFYTYTFTSPEIDEAILAELGANDPNYNLRRERSFILRANESRHFNFAAVLEPHGQYSHAEEFARETQASVRSVRLLQQEGRDVVVIETEGGQHVAIGVSWEAGDDAVHTLASNGESYRWTGFFGAAAPRR